MDRPAGGDSEELYELLSGATERYSTVRAAVVHRVDAAVAREANQRFVDWRFDRGSPGMAIIGKPGPPEPEDFYHDHQDSEERIYLWHQVQRLFRRLATAITEYRVCKRGPRHAFLAELDEASGAEYDAVSQRRYRSDPAQPHARARLSRSPCFPAIF